MNLSLDKKEVRESINQGSNLHMDIHLFIKKLFLAQYGTVQNVVAIAAINGNV